MLTWWDCSSFLLTKWHSHCANSSQTCGRHRWQPGLTLPSRVGNTELDQLKAQDRAKTEVEKLKKVVKLQQVPTKQKKLGYWFFWSSCHQSMGRVETATFPGAGSTHSAQKQLSVFAECSPPVPSVTESNLIFLHSCKEREEFRKICCHFSNSVAFPQSCPW